MFLISRLRLSVRRCAGEPEATGATLWTFSHFDLVPSVLTRGKTAVP